MKSLDQDNLEPLESLLCKSRMGKSRLEKLRLGQVTTGSAPPELRAAVLGQVHRELRASRRDRRMAIAASLLLAVGVAMNVALQRPQAVSTANLIALRPTPRTIVVMAIHLATGTIVGVDDAVVEKIAVRLTTLGGLSPEGEETDMFWWEIDHDRNPTVSDSGSRH